MAEIQVSRLKKSFGEFVAVQDSSFTIQNGEFFVMLGPSGCGKTTTSYYLVFTKSFSKNLRFYENILWTSGDKYFRWPLRQIWNTRSLSSAAAGARPRRIARWPDTACNATSSKSATSAYPWRTGAWNVNRSARKWWRSYRASLKGCS